MDLTSIINTGILSITLITSIIGLGFLLNYKNQREWNNWDKNGR